jgi:hypothetical protein
MPVAWDVLVAGTCRVPLTSGEVDMEHDGGITDEDMADGVILVSRGKARDTAPRN